MNGRCGARSRIHLCQAGEKTGFVAQRRHDRVIGMPRLPVRQNHHPRAQLAQYARNLDAIFKGVFDRAIGQVERLPPANAEQLRRFCRFRGPFFGAAARAGLALRQVQNRCAQSARRHAQQCAAAGLFHVVAMGRDGQNIGT